MKSMYFLSNTSSVNLTEIKDLLLNISQIEVTFNKMVLFQSQTLINYDA
jgi:hypothetical protein